MQQLHLTPRQTLAALCLIQGLVLVGSAFGQAGDGEPLWSDEFSSGTQPNRAVSYTHLTLPTTPYV